MNIDNEIFLAKCEKFLESVWNKNHTEIFNIDRNLNEDAHILNIKYNNRAEALREYDYISNVNNLLREKVIDPKMALSLREDISEAMTNVHSNSLDLIEEGYCVLSNIYTLMKSDLFESFKQFAKNPDWDEKYINLVRGRTNAYEKKHGKFKTKEERERKEDEVAQSLQHKRIDKKAAKEKATATKLANDNYKARLKNGRPEHEAADKRDSEIKNMHAHIDLHKNTEKSKYVRDN